MSQTSIDFTILFTSFCLLARFIAAGELTEDESKGAYSSYSCQGVFKLHRLQARSMGRVRGSEASKPSDTMYAVEWLAHSTQLIRERSHKHGGLSWEDTSERKLFSCSRRHSSLQSAVCQSIATLQQAVVQGLSGVVAHAIGGGLQVSTARQATGARPISLDGQTQTCNFTQAYTL